MVGVFEDGFEHVVGFRIRRVAQDFDHVRELRLADLAGGVPVFENRENLLRDAGVGIGVGENEEVVGVEDLQRGLRGLGAFRQVVAGLDRRDGSAREHRGDRDRRSGESGDLGNGAFRCGRGRIEFPADGGEGQSGRVGV